jgi:hypothetical protein
VYHSREIQTIDKMACAQHCIGIMTAEELAYYKQAYLTADR